MKKQSRMFNVIFVTLLLFMLTGCWDQQEINERAYVLGIGLDQAEDGQVKVTYLISNPEVGSTQQGGGSEEPTHEIISFDATSFIQSQDIANAVVAKTITYDILDIFVISEEFAQNKDFIRWIYDATKDREIRRDTKIIVSKEKALKFMENNQPKLETRRHEYFEVMLNTGTEKGLIPNSEINNFFRVTEADAGIVITAFATAEEDEEFPDKNVDSELIAGKLNIKGNTNPTQFLGSAVFKEGQMIGKLTMEETRLAQMVNVAHEKPSFLASIKDPFNPDYWLTIRLSQLKAPSVEVDVSRKTPKIQVNLPLKVEVLTDHSMVSYAEHKEKRAELKTFLEEKIKEQFEALVKKTQEEFKGQPFAFSLAARKKFLTIAQWEEYDWMGSYPDADVDLQADIRFGEFGRQGELPPYSEVRD